MPAGSGPREVAFRPGLDPSIRRPPRRGLIPWPRRCPTPGQRPPRLSTAGTPPDAWPWVHDWDNDGVADTLQSTSWIYGGGAPFRHGGRCNVLYAGGHVGSLPAREWLLGRDGWSPD